MLVSVLVALWERTCAVQPVAAWLASRREQRISDTLITVDFYAADTAKRLRRDAAAKLGPATGYDEVIADQPATCVDVPLVGGTAVYCALASGLLAKLDDGDVAVTLTLYGDTVDASAFTPPA